MPPAIRKQIKKGSYSFLDLVKLRLADILLSCGIPGKQVQPLIDGDLLKAARLSGDVLTASLLVIYDGIHDPQILTFPRGHDFAEFDKACKYALAIGAAFTTLSFASIMRNILERVTCHQEHREYVPVNVAEELNKLFAKHRSGTLVKK